MQAELRRPVVAVPAYGFRRGPRRLPQMPEEPTAAVAPTVYDQMACDPEVAAALLLLVYFALADGVQNGPAVGEKDERFELASDVLAQIERTVEGLERPLKETLEMMLRDALTHGSKVAEKVYKIPTAGDDAYKLILSQIKVKPKGSTAFVVDQFMNLVGLVPAQRGVSPRLDGESRVISPEKFVIATFRMRDEDPRGNSILRPAVKAWNIKTMGLPEFLTYAMRCAVPGMVGILGPNAKDQTTTENGVTTTVSAIDTMLSALVEFRNSTAIALDNGAQVTPLEVESEGEFWERFFKILNKEITKAILLQELATRDGDRQTRASTETQFSVIDVLVRSIKCWLEQIIYAQIYYPQVVYNFGEEIARELTPRPSLGDSDRRDWAEDSAAVVELCTATMIDADGNTVPLLTYSQIQSLLTQIGIPAPSEEEVEAMRAAKSDDEES